MAKQNILHICLSHGWGGLEMYPLRIGKEFLNQGYNVYGLCLANSRVAEGMKEAKIDTFEVENKNNLLLQLPKLNRWLKENRVDVIHCHKSGDVVVAALLDVLSSRKIIFTEHMGVTRPKKDLYHRWVYSHVDQVLSISDETYKRNVNALPVPLNKIQRLWLGTEMYTPIESKEEIKAIKKELSVPVDADVVGVTGRIARGKGQGELLDAFISLEHKYPNLHLLIVGGLTVKQGSEDEFVAQLQATVKEHNLENRVHFSGFRSDTKRMYAAMDIVCLPCHHEAFGLTVIEAMAAKKAIVGANTGALPEILEDTAQLCSPLLPNEIAGAIEFYLNNPQARQKAAEKAYARATDEFSMQTHINKLSSIYSIISND
ncbi:glycosyltransferase family 4 protein [Vibrio sp. Of7-15]|uniref:glycosyltransferase family 4 protein n=1 Tax=Vibrio sp. Of7-15 TaxID=2724879 RepID=UPI001EF2596D|nr:glycosyltransferase family 4 protein [Vibrio sp. Of7-15]MCG7496829.1 glycosyltransferase family 4 protein [Vibrio sp. Of7-15]